MLPSASASVPLNGQRFDQLLNGDRLFERERLGPLPAGSRVTLAGWGPDADGEQFLSAQRSAGITTETILLDASANPAMC